MKELLNKFIAYIKPYLWNKQSIKYVPAPALPQTEEEFNTQVIYPATLVNFRRHIINKLLEIYLKEYDIEEARRKQIKPGYNKEAQFSIEKLKILSNNINLIEKELKKLNSLMQLTENNYSSFLKLQEMPKRG